MTGFDQFWVNHNRKVLKEQTGGIKSNEDEIIVTNGNDFALHAVES